jgi:type I restriction enzyme, S subunit
MKTIQFRDFIILQRGFDLPIYNRDEGEYPVISATGIHGSHSEFKVNPPGVVTGRSGSLGEVVFVEHPYWPLNTTLWVKDFKGNEPRYVYYFLKTLDLKRFNSGAGVPTLNRNHLDTLVVKIHDRQNQRKIASVLAAYDDLIENNLRRIKILEEIAQTLYREWFVKFHFPGHEKVKMMDSPLGKIPEGWEVGSLDDVLVTLESGSRPKGGIDPEARGVPSIGAENIIGLGKYDYSKDKFVTREFFQNMRRGQVHSGDVLLYKDGAQIGRKSIFRDGFPYTECCINEHVFILRTNRQCTQNYLFFWLDQPEMTQNIINLNANAAQPGINQSGVRGLPILLAPAHLLEKAEQVLDPILGAIFSMAKKNNILRQTRDLLLPKLISGEVDVSDLDIKTDEPE